MHEDDKVLPSHRINIDDVIEIIKNEFTDDTDAPSKARSRQLVQIQHEERVSRHLRTEPHTRSGNRPNVKLGGRDTRPQYNGCEGYKPRNSDDLGSRRSPCNGRQQSQH